MTTDRSSDALERFQRQNVHLGHPDGRVDPGGRTLKALLKAAEEVDYPAEPPFHALGRSQSGGDVVHLLCEVVPRLAVGVLVHVHDIYLPYAYPRAWYEDFGWYWAEQYMLQAFLAFNCAYEPLVSVHLLARMYRERLRELVLGRMPQPASGGSGTVSTPATAHHRADATLGYIAGASNA